MPAAAALTAPPTISTGAGGVRILTEELPWLGSVAIGLVIPYGSARESAATNGAAHFIEHLVFKGTRRRTARDLALAIERHGGSLNAATERELTTYYCRIDAAHLTAALDVLADLCFQAEFNPTLVERERKVVASEIEGNLDDPDYFLFDHYLRAVWGNTGMGRSVTGTPATLAGLTRDQLFGIYRREYRPERMRLVVTGGITHQQVQESWAKVWQRNASSDLPESNGRSRVVIPAYRPGVHVWPRPAEQASLILGWPGLHYGHPDRHAFACLDGILAAGMGSRLFQALRERRGLVYDIGAMHLPFARTGLYAIEAGCAPSDLDRVLEGILREVDRLREEPVSAAELARIQDFLCGSFTLGLESPTGRMFRLALSDVYLGRWEAPAEVIAATRAVTPTQVHKLARRLFQPKLRSLGVVVPEGWEGRLRL